MTKTQTQPLTIILTRNFPRTFPGIKIKSVLHNSEKSEDNSEAFIVFTTSVKLEADETLALIFEEEEGSNLIMHGSSLSQVAPKSK